MFLYYWFAINATDNQPEHQIKTTVIANKWVGNVMFVFCVHTEMYTKTHQNIRLPYAKICILTGTLGYGTEPQHFLCFDVPAMRKIWCWIRVSNETMKKKIKTHRRHRFARAIIIICMRYIILIWYALSTYQYVLAMPNWFALCNN